MCRGPNSPDFALFGADVDASQTASTIRALVAAVQRPDSADAVSETLAEMVRDL